MLQRLLQRLRSSYPAAVTFGEKVLQTKVKTRYFGSRGFDGLMLSIGDDNEVDVSQRVPFDGQGFDLPIDVPGLEELLLLFSYNDVVPGYCVSGLFQGEALILDSLPKRRRPDFPGGFALQVLEEKRV